MFDEFVKNAIVWSKVFAGLIAILVAQVVVFTILGKILRGVWSITKKVAFGILYAVCVVSRTFNDLCENVAKFILWIADMIVDFLCNPMISWIIYFIIFLILKKLWQFELSPHLFLGGSVVFSRFMLLMNNTILD